MPHQDTSQDQEKHHSGERDKMKPEDVEQTLPRGRTKPDSYPGGDQDDEMTDDIHPEAWEEEWRPSDKAQEQNLSVEE